MMMMLMMMLMMMMCLLTACYREMSKNNRKIKDVITVMMGELGGEEEHVSEREVQRYKSMEKVRQLPSIVHDPVSDLLHRTFCDWYTACFSSKYYSHYSPVA